MKSSNVEAFSLQKDNPLYGPWTKENY